MVVLTFLADVPFWVDGPRLPRIWPNKLKQALESGLQVRFSGNHFTWFLSEPVFRARRFPPDES